MNIVETAEAIISTAKLKQKKTVEKFADDDILKELNKKARELNKIPENRLPRTKLWER